MRTRTESQVRQWLKSHPEEALKILGEIDTSPKNEFQKERLLSGLMESIIINTSNLTKKLDSFSTKICELFQVEKCAVFIFNRDTNVLTVEGERNWGTHVSVAISQGIVGRSASSNEIIFVKNPSQGIMQVLMTKMPPTIRYRTHILNPCLQMFFAFPLRIKWQALTR